MSPTDGNLLLADGGVDEVTALHWSPTDGALYVGTRSGGLKSIGSNGSLTDMLDIGEAGASILPMTNPVQSLLPWTRQANAGPTVLLQDRENTVSAGFPQGFTITPSGGGVPRFDGGLFAAVEAEQRLGGGRASGRSLQRATARTSQRPIQRGEPDCAPAASATAAGAATADPADRRTAERPRYSAGTSAGRPSIERRDPLQHRTVSRLSGRKRRRKSAKYSASRTCARWPPCPAPTLSSPATALATSLPSTRPSRSPAPAPKPISAASASTKRRSSRSRSPRARQSRRAVRHARRGPHDQGLARRGEQGKPAHPARRLSQHRRDDPGSTWVQRAYRVAARPSRVPIRALRRCCRRRTTDGRILARRANTGNWSCSIFRRRAKTQRRPTYDDANYVTEEYAGDAVAGWKPVARRQRHRRHGRTVRRHKRPGLSVWRRKFSWRSPATSSAALPSTEPDGDLSPSRRADRSMSRTSRRPTRRSRSADTKAPTSKRRSAQTARWWRWQRRPARSGSIPPRTAASSLSAMARKILGITFDSDRQRLRAVGDDVGSPAAPPSIPIR